MAEFVCFDSNVEAVGQGIMVIVAALGDKALPTLAKYELDDLDPEGWYPQQPFLDAFRELSQQGFFNMVACGMKVPDVAAFPPMETVEEALSLVGQAYQMNHRGGDIGEYTLKEIGDRKAEMYCRNPYPSDFDYGIIYRLVQKYRPEDSKGFKVVRDEEVPNRKTGADACTYYIEW